MKGLLVAMAAAMIQVVQGEHWAVIAAGSTGYWNYRHQADACHAYQVVRRHGIPASNIILMMYDDVANSTSNPYPGQLFNHPKTFKSDAFDVYKDCQVDYRGDDVTPKKFLQVLLGDEAAGGKVLKSTSNDRVFVNFVDHGAPGFVVFPNGNLYATDLIATLKKMHSQKKYKELVLYVEACESGSMFKNLLPNDIDVYATTAANDHESSWGTYCPPLGDKVGAHLLGTCLGDLYSVNWMEDSDASDLSKETIHDQFLRVKKKTNKSHVLQFGSETIPNEPVGDFQGTSDSSALENGNGEGNLSVDSSMDARDIEVVTKFYQYLRAPANSRHDLAQTLIHAIQSRDLADKIFHEVENLVLRQPATLVANDDPTNDSCIRQVNDEVARSCSGYSDYSLKYASKMLKLCHIGYDSKHLTAQIKAACGRHLHGNVFEYDRFAP